MKSNKNLASLFREAKKTTGKNGEVSTALRRNLGEDMAQMFNTIGRQLFADIRDSVRGAIGSSLNKHKTALQKAVTAEFGRRGANKAEEYVADWLEEIVGDGITAVAEEVYSDLESISDLMLAEGPEEEMTDEGEEDMSDEGEESSDADEESSDEEEDTGEGETEEEKEAFFEIEESIQEIKTSGLALAAKIASAGNADVAAKLRVAMRSL